MRYEFRIYDKETNDILFETAVEGPDKHRCAASAAMAGKEAGFNLTSIGKSVRAITENMGDPQPYTFQLKQIDFDPAEHEGKIAGRRYEAQERYDAKNTKQIRLKLNVNTDADILEKLDAVGNKQGYIKELIRRDIHKGSE